EPCREGLRQNWMACPRRDCRSGPVGAEKRQSKVPVELRPILDQAASQSVKRFDRKSFQVGTGFHHDWRHCADEHCRGNTLGAITPDVSRNLTSPSRVAYHSDVLEVESLNHARQILGVGIHLIAIPRLA